MIIEVMLEKNQEIIPTNAAQIKPDGTMVSKPLEDMYPFLPREEFLADMVIEPVEE
jgi:acetolactate synthase-1/2/3 large subunit